MRVQHVSIMLRTVLVAICIDVVGCWSPFSWKRVAVQSRWLPQHFDTPTYRHVLTKLQDVCPLFFPEEQDRLIRRLADASSGRSFVLMKTFPQESFLETNVMTTWSEFSYLLRLSFLFTLLLAKPVVRVSHCGGSFVPDTLSVSDHNPVEMLKQYHMSVQIINIIRAFIQGGYSDIGSYDQWLSVEKSFPSLVKHVFPEETETSFHLFNRFDHLAKISKLLELAQRESRNIHSYDTYFGHELVSLSYHSSLSRWNKETNECYNAASQMLWVRDGRRSIGGPYLEYLRGVSNPIAIELCHSLTPTDLETLVRTLNPRNISGRLSFIINMKDPVLKGFLSDLLRETRTRGFSIVFLVNPKQSNLSVCEELFHEHGAHIAGLVFEDNDSIYESYRHYLGS